jgi:hypothetical protein
MLFCQLGDKPPSQGEIVVDPDVGDKATRHTVILAIYHHKAFPVKRPLRVDEGKVRSSESDMTSGRRIAWGLT